MATLSSSGWLLRRNCGYELQCRTEISSKRRLLIFARKKRTKPKDLSKQRNFEDGMMVWDDVFEKCCEEPLRAAHLVDVATKGMEQHGRGCVLVRETTSPVTKGAGTGFVYRARPLVPPPASIAAGKRPPRPAFYKSYDWGVSYIPRSFILNPSLAPLDENDPAAAAARSVAPALSSSSEILSDVDEQTKGDVLKPVGDDSQENDEIMNSADTLSTSDTSKDQSLSEQAPVADEQPKTEVANDVLVRRTDLLAVLGAMDRTRVLSLTAERIVRDSISSRAVQVNDNEQDAGGEEAYRHSDGEIVLLLSVEFDGRPVVGADVVQARKVESRNTGKVKWKLSARDYRMF